MAGQHDLDIALRIQADMGAALQELAKITGKLGELRAQGNAAAEGLGRTADAHRRAEAAARAAGVSVGQYNQAMRQLPMQITDIVTGLATGQSPFMLLMQQGGQLKDSFGGIVPAARALGGSVLGLVNPFTLAAAASAALAVAWYRGDQEGRAFAETAILIGERGGVTATKLNALTAAFDELNDVTQGQAAEALNTIARSGQFTIEQMELVGKAALQMQAATGRSIEDTTEAFAKLRKDPVQALLELTAKENFLTKEVYAQVTALVEQGRMQEAVTLAFKTYAGVIDERTGRVVENLGYVERGYRALTGAAREFWDAVLDIGRQQSTAEQLQAAEATLQRLRDSRFTPPITVRDAEARVARLREQLTQEEALAKQEADTRAARNVDAEQERKRVDERKQFLAEEARYLTESEKRQREIDDVKGKLERKVISQTEAARRLAQIEASHDDSQKGREQRRKAFLDAESRYLTDSEKKQRDINEVNELVTAKIISQAEATERLARIETEYAEKAATRGAQKKTEAEQAEQAAQKELANLREQVALNATLKEGKERITEEDRIRYAITEDTLRLAREGTKEQLLLAARQRDAQRAEREEPEKAKEAYQALVNDLQTPIDSAIARVTAQMRDLQQAMSQMSPEEAAERQQQIIEQNVPPLPNIGAEALRDYGVGDDEADRMAQMGAYLEAEYAARREIINAARQQEGADQAAWNKASEDLEAQHQANLSSLAQSESMMRLGQLSSAFGSMAQIAKTFGGEQSKTYQALFALSKGFAVAQLATSLAINVAKASEVGFPHNIGLIAAAMQQGAQIASILAGANYSGGQGYATGGQIRGPGTPTSDSIPIWASNREYMVRAASATQPGAVDFLDDFNQRGMLALHDWAHGFAEGGLITAPVEPRVPISDNAALMRATNNNSFRLYNLFDQDAMAAALANHPAMEKRIIVVAGENGGAIRGNW